ncbi:hypothetical protein BDV97DRAFT_397007 [Delphinella strobiligena]|nr:hypothetical protein BDV97DRAFT_397007 [Delphinella strobiligena]
MAHQSKDGGPAFYIVCNLGGMCGENTPNGTYDKKCIESKEQQWTIEYGDTSDIVAFQNVANGEYLFATAGAGYSQIKTSTTKQWWNLEKYNATGSYWIKCNDYPNAYLCNAHGYKEHNTQVYVWPKEAVWDYTLVWYLVDAKASGFKPQGYTATGQGEEFQKREAALAEKEQALKEVEQREAQLAEKEQRFAAQEAAQKQLADQLATKEKELAELRDSTLKTSDDSSAGEKDLASKATDLQNQLDALRARERDLAAKEAAASEQEKQVQKREVELADKQSHIEQALKELQQCASSKNGDSETWKAENDQLKQRIQDLQRQLHDAQESSASPCTHGALVDSEEVSKLRDENARLRDLIVQALQSHESQRRRPAKLATGNITAGAHGAPKPITKAPTATSTASVNASNTKIPSATGRQHTHTTGVTATPTPNAKGASASKANTSNSASAKVPTTTSAKVSASPAAKSESSTISTAGAKETTDPKASSMTSMKSPSTTNAKGPNSSNTKASTSTGAKASASPAKSEDPATSKAPRGPSSAASTHKSNGVANISKPLRQSASINGHSGSKPLSSNTQATNGASKQQATWPGTGATPSKTTVDSLISEREQGERDLKSTGNLSDSKAQAAKGVSKPQAAASNAGTAAGKTSDIEKLIRQREQGEKGLKNKENVSDSNTKVTSGVSKPQASKASAGAASSECNIQHLIHLRDQREKELRNKENLSNSVSTAAAKQAGGNYKVPDVKSENEEDGTVTFNCGHVLYAPPRKIERRIVAILYE